MITRASQVLAPDRAGGLNHLEPGPAPILRDDSVHSFVHQPPRSYLFTCSAPEDFVRSSARSYFLLNFLGLQLPFLRYFSIPGAPCSTSVAIPTDMTR